MARFRYVAAISGGQVDPQDDPWREMTLIAPNHVESGTGRLLSVESAWEQGADSGKYLVAAGQLVYSKIRPALNKVTIAPRECLCSADMYAITFGSQVSSRYAFYYMLARPFHSFATVMSMRVKMPKVNREELADAPWLLPPLAEQRAIADFLDRETAQIDTLIAKQEALIATLRERRAAALDALVGRLTIEPVPLKREADMVTVGIVVQPSQWYVDEGVPALRGNNVRPERIELTDLVHLSVEGNEVHSKSRLREGDVVVVRTGQSGAAAVVTRGLAGANAIDLLIVRPGTSLVGDYLAMILNSPALRDSSAQEVVGTIQGHLNVRALKNMLVKVPSVHEQRAIVSEWRGVSAQIDTLIVKAERFIELAKERRAALITAAVTGQIAVPA